MKQEFIVSNMACEGCKKKVSEAIEGIQGIQKYHIDLNEKKVWIDKDDSVQTNAIIQAIDDAGYQAKAI
ncbi:MAG TPA: heavy-metal-associated domain-containing protein [Candidatus Tetragenococcus pullicola]|nr:heavy-metal-associated domain-containing protein [Candidatus Tetragenococcus pullicola]